MFALGTVFVVAHAIAYENVLGRIHGSDSDSTGTHVNLLTDATTIVVLSADIACLGNALYSIGKWITS